jgi:small subunit ribosomal protein S6
LPSYELMFIVKPELEEEQVTSATDRVHQLVVANGGSVTKTAAWGKRRLAYQVGSYKEGHYVVSNFDLPADKVTEVERVLKISDTVFRHLLVRRERPVVGQAEVVVPEMAEGEDFNAIRPEAADTGSLIAPGAEEVVAAVGEEDVPPAESEEVEDRV